MVVVIEMMMMMSMNPDGSCREAIEGNEGGGLSVRHSDHTTTPHQADEVSSVYLPPPIYTRAAG